MRPETLPGDCGLSCGTGLIAKTIIWAEKMQTGEANRSHAYIYIGEAMIIESLVEVTISDESKYDDQDIEIWRLPIPYNERLRMRKELMKLAGENYGWFKLPLHLADSLASGFLNLFRKEKKPVFWFTKHFGITSFKLCSHLYVYALHTWTGYRLLNENHKQVDWRECSPDYLQDLFACPHNKAQLLYKSKKS